MERVTPLFRSCSIEFGGGGKRMADYFHTQRISAATGSLKLLIK